jgi:hypothetical protein
MLEEVACEVRKAMFQSAPRHEISLNECSRLPRHAPSCTPRASCALALFASLIGGCQAHSPAPNETTPHRGSTSTLGSEPAPHAALPKQSPSTTAASSTDQGGAPPAGVPAEAPSAGSKSACPLIDPAPRPSSATKCGPLDCLAFDRAEDAFAYVIRETSPVVLAIGEIHAQRGNDLKASPTRRFATILPMFCGFSRHIVIELWTGRNDCGDHRVEDVHQAQKPVTSAQAETNQDDFLQLGNVAKAHHIQPHALVPSCEDLQAILSARAGDIAKMLELTATRTADLAEELLKARPNPGREPYVILYGGAMHNDITPGEGREAFSYGPRLASSTKNRLTELDIVLREQIRDTESFRRFAWYPHFRSGSLEPRFSLYRTGPRSFTLIFPNQSYLP